MHRTATGPASGCRLVHDVHPLAIESASVGPYGHVVHVVHVVARRAIATFPDRNLRSGRRWATLLVMYFDEFKHQLPDIDPSETDDWMTSLDQVVEQEGETRARFLVYKLLKRARQLQIGLPPLTQTRFINTISP